MDTISVLLKNYTLIFVGEIKILEQHAQHGRYWHIIEKPKLNGFHTTKYTSVEYLFDIESLLIFTLASPNILASWNTSMTRHIRPGQEFQIKENIYIEPIDMHIV